MKKKQYIFRVCTILWILIIFNFSLTSIEGSMQQSSAIVELISKIIRPFNVIVPYETLSFFVRKTAHFTEYLIFAVLLFLSLSQPIRTTLQKCILLFSGPAIALFDEKIVQAYVAMGRGSSFMDIGIDSAGYFTGIGLMLLIYSHLKKRKKNKLL